MKRGWERYDPRDGETRRARIWKLVRLQGKEGEREREGMREGNCTPVRKGLAWKIIERAIKSLSCKKLFRIYDI